MTPDTASVVVTGGSSGIGAATVAALVRARFRVWATVREPDDAERLTGQYGTHVRPLLMDLTDEGSIRAAGTTICDAGPLYGLVNNAGIATSGPLETLPLTTLRNLLEVNVVGQLAITQAVLPALRASPTARIVVVGSIGGRIATPMLGAYTASKHALTGLTGSLAAELEPSGIRVVLIEPGATATPIWTTGTAQRGTAVTGATGATGADSGSTRSAAISDPYAAMERKTEERARRNAVHGMPPDEVATAILDALVRRDPAPRRLVGRSANMIAALQRYLPARLFTCVLQNGA